MHREPYEETEDPDARFKDKIKMRAYPVEQKAGLLFAYLGPAPAPLVPNWDVYAATGVVRHRTPMQLAAVPGELPRPGALGVAARSVGELHP